MKSKKGFNAPMDYRSFSKDGPQNDTTGLDRRWWLGPTEKRADNLMGILQFMNEHDTTRQFNYQLCSRLYGNLAMIGVNGLSSQVNSQQNVAMSDRLTYNLVQSVIDTIVSKLAPNKPKPMFLTSGGTWSLHRKAKKLNTFADGIFYENKTYDLFTNIARDGEVWGDGFM